MKTVKRIVSIVLCVIMAFSCITCNASAANSNYLSVTVSAENIKFGIGDSISRVFVSFFRGFANQFLSADKKLLTDIELETQELNGNTIRIRAYFNDGVEPKEDVEWFYDSGKPVDYLQKSTNALTLQNLSDKPVSLNVAIKIGKIYTKTNVSLPAFVVHEGLHPLYDAASGNTFYDKGYLHCSNYETKYHNQEGKLVSEQQKQIILKNVEVPVAEPSASTVLDQNNTFRKDVLDPNCETVKMLQKFCNNYELEATSVRVESKVIMTTSKYPSCDKQLLDTWAQYALELAKVNGIKNGSWVVYKLSELKRTPSKQWWNVSSGPEDIVYDYGYYYEIQEVSYTAIGNIVCCGHDRCLGCTIH